MATYEHLRYWSFENLLYLSLQPHKPNQTYGNSMFRNFLFQDSVPIFSLSLKKTLINAKKMVTVDAIL